MKIGILTLPQETNYGGILQAFALQRILRSMGHDAMTIDRHKRKEYPSLKVHIAGYCKRLFQHYLQRKENVSVKWDPFISVQDYKAVSEKTQAFIKRNIKMTRWVYTDQLAEIDCEYQFDAYVVGSDQVWLDYYCPSSFLDFVKRPGVKKLFYAASCGKQSFFNNSAKVALCRELVKSFCGVSVREESLLRPCKEKLGVDALWVLDPTMLLDRSVYLEATECNVDSKPVVFSYILDQNLEKDALVNAVAAHKNLPVVNGNRKNSVKNAVFPSVDDWLQNINRSEFVVTDSFHGTVFAILFNKPFVTIGNVGRGLARFESLLGRLGLLDRLVEDIQSDVILKLSDKQIDFSKVNGIIDDERANSLDFLINSLK